MIDELQQNPEDISPTEEQDAILSDSLLGDEFEGIKLQPFSYQRRRAAYSLGLRFGSLSSDQAKDIETNGFYQGIDTDALLVLWLCTLPKSEVIKALRLPSQAYETMLNFGEKYNIEPGHKNFQFAVTWLMTQLINIIKTSGLYKNIISKTDTELDRPSDSKN